MAQKKLHTGREKGTFSYGQSLNMITHFWGYFFFLILSLLQDHDTSWRGITSEKDQVDCCCCC